MVILLGIAAYLACSIGDYMLFRALIRAMFGEWTVKDRNFAVFCAAFGPFGLVSTGLVWLIHCPSGKEKARW